MIWIVLVWLFVCAWQDIRRREVANVLTLPAVAGMMVWRVIHPDALAFILSGVVFVLGLLGVLPGGDAKGLIVLALFSPELLTFALLATGLIWAGYRLFHQRSAPGYVGFFAGTVLYLAIWR